MLYIRITLANKQGTMKHLLFIITFQLFTFNLYAQSSEIGVLYQFKSSSGLVWKTFGQDKVQPKYEGEVSNGAPDGFGVLSYPFSYGKSVVGEWKIGKEWFTEHYNKEGTLLGKYVKGEWILKWGVLFHHSKKDGIEGWYEDGDEKKDRKYVGDVTNGKPNGQGTETSPEGEKYEGEWKDGKKEGQGKFIQVDGSKYVGEWINGERNGYGTLTSTNGTKYVGKWKDGKKNGQGIFTSSGGSRYVGEFRNDKRNGYGTFTWPDGGKYEGEWENGIFHGQGTITLADGEKYEGEWKEGEKHGQGIYSFLDESKYEGEFIGNEPWNVTFYDKDGNIIWKMVNGKQVDDVYIKDSLRNLLSTNNGVMKSCWGLDLLKAGQTTFIKVDKNNKVKGGFVYEILKKFENVTGIKIKFRIEKTFQNCIDQMRNGTNDVMAGLLEKGDRNTYMDYYYWGKGKDDQFKQIVISKNSPFAKHSNELKTSMYFMQN